MALVYLSIAFVTGIYLGSRAVLPLSVVLPLIFVALLIALTWRRNRILLLAGLCLILLFCGALRFQAVSTGDALQPYIGQGTMDIVGVVVEDPEPGDSSTTLLVSVREIRVEGEWEEVSGTTLVRTTRYPTHHYGDMLQVSGELQEPPQLDDFDYRAYLARQGIYSTIYYPEIDFLAGGHGPQPLQSIYSFRSRMAEAMEGSLSEPQGSVAEALVLGIRSNVPPSTYQDFQRSGTAHLLAISGLHMAIVAGILLSISVALFGRRRPTYFVATLSALWIYALLAGMSPSVTRAAIMVSLFLFAAYLGRQRSVITALAFAGAIMVAINPQILWQVSFQLSFAAVAGLVLIGPIFQQWGTRIRAPTIVVDSFSVTLAAIVATLPLIAYYFGYVSLVGLPATFLALPALPAVIVLSAVVGLIGLFALPLAQVIGWVDWLFLGYMTGVVKLFAAAPWSSVEVSGMDVFLVVLYYALLGGTLWLVTGKQQLSSRVKAGARGIAAGATSFSRKLPAIWALIPLLVIAILVWAAATAAPSGDKLTVSFLDVGQGDAILIQRGSQQVLIDGGPSSEKICLELGERLPFWDKTIELVVLTHPQDDHLLGLVEVLSRYNVGEVLEPGFEFETSAYGEWLRLIAEKDIDRTIAYAGQQVELGNGIRIEVLHPQEEFLEGTASDVNENSIVLRLVWDEVSFLLTGDIAEEAEWQLLHQYGRELKGTVLKVAHHGSATSTSSSFLVAVSPQVAVISVGEDNRFGHPSPEVMARLSERLGGDNIYLTAERGTVTFTTDGERLWVKTER